MQRIIIHRAAILALMLSLGLPAAAKQRSPAPLPRDPASDPLMLAAGFLDHHPDLRYRLQGMEAYKAGHFAKAHGLYERAAFYGDKPSQGLVAEMLWKGEGVTRDRALAYAWMDLAAERGYRPLLILRERYWNALDEAERAEAIERGAAIYARYGDAVAKPRYANILRRGRMQVTGSRTGYDAGIRIAQPGADGTLDPSSTARADVYDARYWHPESYWALQDRIWIGLPRGEVIVQPLRPDDEADAVAPSGAPDRGDGHGED